MMPMSKTRLPGTASRRPVVHTAASLELEGRSAAVSRLDELLRRASLIQSGVLITAEPGADVESVAHELHLRSRGPQAPFVIVRCTAPEAANLDRLLFGPASDAAPAEIERMTASSQIAAAQGGTLFLQDATELPAAAQARLARLARDGEALIDGVRTPISIRFVASVSAAIDADLREHRFRADLFRRLAACRIDLPPLRERAEDIPMVASQLCELACVQRGEPARGFTQAALGLLAALRWPGNLAELRAVIEQVLDETDDATIQVERVLPALQLDKAKPGFAPAGTLREARLRFEREYISAVLQHHGWRVADAAETLGIQRPNLYRKARQLGIPLARLTDTSE